MTDGLTFLLHCWLEATLRSWRLPTIPRSHQLFPATWISATWMLISEKVHQLGEGIQFVRWSPEKSSFEEAQDQLIWAINYIWKVLSALLQSRLEANYSTFLYQWERITEGVNIMRWEAQGLPQSLHTIADDNRKDVYHFRTLGVGKVHGD